MTSTSFFRKMAVAVGTATFLAPSLAFAATPQQMLNSSLVTLHNYPSTRVTGTININVSERSWSKTHTPTHGTVGISFDYRVVTSTGSLHEGEGRFTLEKFSFTTDGAAPSDPGLFPSLTEITLPEPIHIDWKSTNKTLYVMISQVPQQLVDMAKAMDIDISPFIGKWLSFDLTQVENLVKEKENLNAETLLSSSGLSSLLNPLQLLRIEKRYKNAQDENLLRMRVRLNPSMIWRLQQAEIKAIDLKAPDRWAQFRAINKRYADLRKTLSHFQIVAVVNGTTGAFERIEIGGAQTETKKTCSWNYTLDRSVCPNTHNQTIQVSVGLSFSADSGAPVVAPVPSTPFLDLVKQLEAVAASSTAQTETVESTTTTQ